MFAWTVKEPADRVVVVPDERLPTAFDVWVQAIAFFAIAPFAG